jgi:hypothetical protein
MGIMTGLEQNRFGDTLSGNYAQIDPDTGVLRFYGNAHALLRSLFIDPTADEPTNPVQGQIWWDQDAETLAIKQNGATLQVGQEFQYHCQNNTGSDILDGTPVMLAGTVGASGRILITPMDGTDNTNARYLLGVATEDIPDGDVGKVTSVGKVRSIDTSAWNEGDILYISPDTIGEFVTTEPVKPNINIPCAVVITKHEQQGSIGVRVTPIDLNAIGSKFGDVESGDYSEFEADGTLSAYGEATTYNDVQFSVSTARVPAANAPTWANMTTNLSAYTFAVNDYIDLESNEISHGYKPGGIVTIHIHLVTNGLDATDRTVKYQVAYAMTNKDGIVSETVASAQYVIPADTPDRTYLYMPITTVNSTGLTFGANIAMQLKRVVEDTGTAPSSDPFVTMVGVHIEMARIGSRNETSD